MDNAFAVMKEKIGFLSGLEHHGKTYDASIRKGQQRISSGTHGNLENGWSYLSQKGKEGSADTVTELNSRGKDDQHPGQGLKKLIISSDILPYSIQEIDHWLFWLTIDWFLRNFFFLPSNLEQFSLLHFEILRLSNPLS